MRIGVTLPQFRDDPSDALAAAEAADREGAIDGVFVFDHLWAIGQPNRPAQSAWPLLGALAARTRHVVLGSLVARVSLEPGAVLVHHVETMLRMVGPDRFIAGLGTGDELSRHENEAYGIPFGPARERVAQLEADAAGCLDLGATVWIGGTSPVITRAARRLGVALNLWAVDPGRVARDAASGEVTWGGVVADAAGGGSGGHDALVGLVRSLREAGATWAVLAPDYRAGEPPGRVVETVSAAVAAA